MLKQGVVQDAITDITNGALPPLNNLPQWSRVNNLDKARYPKPFLKDRLAPLPNPPAEKRRDSLDSDDKDLDEGEALQNPQIRIQHLEKSLHFLRSQHREVLDNLHEEIDGLKRENKELQFKIVMVQKNSPPNTGASKKERKSAKSQRGASGGSRVVPSSSEQYNNHTHSEEQLSHVSDDKMEELKLIFLEDELKEVKKALRDERSKSHYLQQLLEAQQKQSASSKGGVKPASAPPVKPQLLQVPRTGPGTPLKRARTRDSRLTDNLSISIQVPTMPARALSTEIPATGESKSATVGKTTPQAEALEGREETGKEGEEEEEQEEESQRDLAPLPFNATLEPLLVHLPDQSPRPPNLQECHVILRHMQKINDRQAHELNSLKTDLRDVLYSHKWTPDAYLLAKAYIAADDERESANVDANSRLPKIPMKHPTRKLPDLAYVQKDAMSLPALRHTVGNKATERRKRTQILQKARLTRPAAGGGREVASAAQLRMQ